MNRAALEHSMRTAIALRCQIARFTKWDRKSYYYPDLPKNYQISQYDEPLTFDGYIDLTVEGRPVRIRVKERGPLVAYFSMVRIKGSRVLLFNPLPRLLMQVFSLMERGRWSCGV